jgi:hypothetical protein
MTSRRLMELYGEALLTWYQEGFRAKTSVPQEDRTAEELAAARNLGCGRKWRASFAKFDPDTHSWKIPQLSLFEGSISFSQTWPRWGSMRAGECSVLPMLEHDTSVKGSGFLPVIGTPIRSQRSRSQDFIRPAKNPFELCPKGSLPSPRWVEKLMGWVDGWTAFEPLETGRFLKWCETHGRTSAGRLSAGKPIRISKMNRLVAETIGHDVR